MKLVKLGEVAEINPKLSGRPGSMDAVSFVGMADVNADGAATSEGASRPFGEVSSGYTLFEDSDLLLAKITPCFENGKIAQARIKHRVGAGSSEFHVIRPRAEFLDSRYALHFLRRAEVRESGRRRMTGAGGQRRVPAEFLSGLELPVLSLDQQRRIAEVLDLADALRTKRRDSIDLLDNARRAIFSEMFVVGAQSNWPVRPVIDIALASAGSIRTGPFGSQLLHSEFTDTGVAVLGIDNAVQNRFAWGARRYIPEHKYRQLQRYTVRPGDVLITIMGTCGRCAVVPEGIPQAINTKHLCCISLDRSKCLPEFLHAYFLFHPVARQYLGQTAKGAIMEGLNMAIIKQLPVVVPPIDQQQAFVSRLREWAASVDVMQAHSLNLDRLFASLQHRAFAGML